MPTPFGLELPLNRNIYLVVTYVSCRTGKELTHGISSLKIMLNELRSSVHLMWP